MITSISVVIPVKDDAKDLRRCLAELLPQFEEYDELVVVDNGSTDGSAAVAREFGARLVRVVGGGIPAASAAGYDAASGAVIARLDADCVPGADWLAVIRQSFIRRPMLGALTGSAHFIDGPVPLRGLLAFVYLGAYFGSLYPALARVPLFGSNCAIRRAVWDDVSELVHRGDLGVHDDLDLSFHLAPAIEVRFSRQLEMGISMRPLFDRAAFANRLRRGRHTVVVHWPHELPWFRWFRRLIRWAR